jgi:hypothetical protein
MDQGSSFGNRLQRVGQRTPSSASDPERQNSGSRAAKWRHEAGGLGRPPARAILSSHFP